MFSIIINRIHEQNTHTQKVELRTLYFNFDWLLQNLSVLGELMVLLFSRAVSQLIICEEKSLHCIQNGSTVKALREHLDLLL